MSLPNSHAEIPAYLSTYLHVRIPTIQDDIK